jgi:hypothetical protein
MTRRAWQVNPPGPQSQPPTSSDPANRAETLEGNRALTLAHPSDGEKALPVLCYSKSRILARAPARCHFTRR